MPEHFSWREVLVPGNKRIDGRTLRTYFELYLKDAALPLQCWTDQCPTRDSADWMGKPLRLELDRKNGNPADNSPANLRLLCPNCHSQQQTDGGSNRGRVEMLSDADETPSGLSYALHESDGTKNFKYYSTGFRSLPTLSCPGCRQELVSRDYRPNKRGGAPNASTFDSCLRRCETCGIGISNARLVDDTVLIFRTPDQGVPENVRGMFAEVIRGSLNVQNRPSKQVKACSESSEDAITWTVFLSLQRAGRLREIFSTLGYPFAQKSSGEPVLLLWGVPVPNATASGSTILTRLIEIADAVGEHPNSRSEPDVVLDFGVDGVMFIEVKHQSPNEYKPDTYSGWTKYIESSAAFLSGDGVRQSGLYELARNWRIAWDLAGERPFWLVNVGPDELFNDNRLSEFNSHINSNDVRAFRTISWKEVRAAIGDNSEWDWLNNWLSLRGIE